MVSLCLAMFLPTMLVQPAFASDEHAAGSAAEMHEGAAAGGHGGHDGAIPWESLMAPAFGVVLFGVGLYFVARKPVADALQSRALTIRSGLDEAARMTAEANAKFSDVESRLVALSRRVDEMKADAQLAADREAENLSLRAAADVVRIAETAERTIREETVRATNSIRSEAARQAIELARAILRSEVNAEDQQRLAREFLATVNKEAPHG